MVWTTHNHKILIDVISCGDLANFKSIWYNLSKYEPKDLQEYFLGEHNHGRSLLMIASKNPNNLEMVKFLISINKTSIDQISKVGVTALYIALSYNCYDISQLLLDEGANVNLLPYLETVILNDDGIIPKNLV